MKIEIEISDDELREHILTAAGKALFADWSVDRNLYKRTIADCVREVIYVGRLREALKDGKNRGI